MAFGKRVIGEEAYATQQKVAAAKVVKGHFGHRVVGAAAVEAVKPVPVGLPQPDAGAAPTPVEPAAVPETAAPVAAYNYEQAIEVAKRNPFDLPRLLEVEVSRPDGPRKTVLRAYKDLALRSGALTEDEALELAERIDKLLGDGE